jgi:hypothetical protein
LEALADAGFNGTAVSFDGVQLARFDLQPFFPDVVVDVDIPRAQWHDPDLTESG